MKAILLAAGLGTRLRPLTDTVPKCLVPIAGRPLLDIWLEQLGRADIRPVLINTHYLAPTVAAYVRASHYAGDVTLVHEPVLLGTGGTLLANRDFVGRASVLVAHADNLCVCDLRAFAVAHQARPAGAAMTMMTFTTAAPESCGVVRLDARGIVTEFHEKVANPPGNLANGAVYIFEPEVVDDAASLGSATVDLSTEVIPRFLGRIYAWHNDGVHLDIGTPSALAAAAAMLETTPLQAFQP